MEDKVKTLIEVYKRELEECGKEIDEASRDRQVNRLSQQRVRYAVIGRIIRDLERLLKQ